GTIRQRSGRLRPRSGLDRIDIRLRSSCSSPVAEPQATAYAEIATTVRRRVLASRPRCDREVRCKAGAAPATVRASFAATATGETREGAAGRGSRARRPPYRADQHRFL